MGATLYLETQSVLDTYTVTDEAPRADHKLIGFSHVFIDYITYLPSIQYNFQEFNDVEQLRSNRNSEIPFCSHLSRDTVNLNFEIDDIQSICINSCHKCLDSRPFKKFYKNFQIQKYKLLKSTKLFQMKLDFEYVSNSDQIEGLRGLSNVDLLMVAYSLFSSFRSRDSIPPSIFLILIWTCCYHLWSL